MFAKGCACVVLVLGLCACDYSQYERGLPISETVLRDVVPMDMADVSTAAPTTRPGPTSVPTQPADELLPKAKAEVKLSIEECRRLALANNLELRVEFYNPTIAQQSISEERARFESVFTASLGYAIKDTPVSTELIGSSTKGLTTEVGVTVPLRTGGQLRFGLPVSRFETDNQFSTLNPAYTSDFAASISHPLLRGAGLAVNSAPIRIANYQYQSSLAATRLSVIRVLADVDRIYWRLYASRQELEVRKKEYDLAVAQLQRAKRQVEAGAAAEVEVIRAESGVADRIEAIINAETSIRMNQRDLKRVINREDLPAFSPTIVVPTSDPNALRYQLDRAKLLNVAMKDRMELLEQELVIARDSLSIDVARNDMLPLVTLDYTYNINGLGGTISDAFHTLQTKRFEDHTVGLRVEVPIGNEAARSRLRRALLSRLQALATKDSRASLIEKEVLDAADRLDANWQRIIAAQRRVILAARVVDQETRQFLNGLRTSTDVLDAQARLADAQTSEIAAVTEYQIAQIDIAFATGTLLGATQVAWAPKVAPEAK